MAPQSWGSPPSRGWSNVDARALPAEPDPVRSVRARGNDIGPPVAIEVAECDAVDRSLAVVPGNFLERAAVSGIEVHRPARFHVADHNIWPAVAIEVGSGQ